MLDLMHDCGISVLEADSVNLPQVVTGMSSIDGATPRGDYEPGD